VDCQRFVLVDVFTDTPLQGNQLGVFTDAGALSGEQMQRLARELNFSESVFVLAPERGGDARIRIFTPSAELSFAGHPVLGAAIALGGEPARASLTLETGLGAIAVALRSERGRPAFARMRQPAPTWAPYEREAQLLDALGVSRSSLPVEAYRNGPLQVYVALEHERQLAALRPDMRALGELGELCASCFAGDPHGGLGTRVFAPGLGVPEDPATGSAAGPLAVHLARHGLIEFGREIQIRQGEQMGRPSLLYALAEGSRSPEHVREVQVGGFAVIVARGEFTLG